LQCSPTAGRRKPTDLLATVFRTHPGDPASLPPTVVQYDLSALAGRLVRLRIAEVDNLFFFQVGVDGVSVTGENVTGTVTLRQSHVSGVKTGPGRRYDR